MSAEERLAVPATRTTDRAVVVLAALAAERAALDRHAGASSAILQTGPGAERAAAAAQAALASGAAALVSWGFAGALASDAQPGTVLVPRTVVTDDRVAFECDAAWQAALVAHLSSAFALDERPLLGSRTVLATADAKARAARASGALAVDMESGAIAAAAQRAGARFVAVRVIVDAQTDELPPGVERWIDARGNRRLAPAFGAVLAPHRWPTLWMLGRRYRLARGVLERLAAALLPFGFALPAEPAR